MLRSQQRLPGVADVRPTMNTACRVVAMFLGTAISSAIPGQGRDLTFQDRVRAQEAIERVEYSHQIGATRPFEEAVPRSVAEAKVRTYLKQSLALERLFNAPITQMALQEEMERVARSTRMPERLEELYSVLENDPLLIQESVIRPALTDRLARALFASDPVIQTEARQKAQKLRDMLLRGQIDPFMERADRTVVTVVRDSGQELAGA